MAHSCHSFASTANVFRGIQNNPLFCGIWLITAALQAIIIQFGSIAFHVCEGGLDGKYWAISMALGMGSLPVQQVINVFYRAGKHYKKWRMKARLEKNYHLQRKNAGGHGRNQLGDRQGSTRSRESAKSH
jgi:Ca2+ transporting ATPase